MKKRIQNVLLLMKNKIGRWRLKIKTERQKREQKVKDKKLMIKKQKKYYFTPKDYKFTL